ncbi:MAG: hypothetical protein Q7R76_06935 [Candidatus Woesearchaeota archaeon]|nr:hypothetical protein [Candidatus Woesearchaeota archaeon]
MNFFMLFGKMLFLICASVKKPDDFRQCRKVSGDGGRFPKTANKSGNIPVGAERNFSVDNELVLFVLREAQGLRTK